MIAKSDKFSFQNSAYKLMIVDVDFNIYEAFDESVFKTQADAADQILEDYSSFSDLERKEFEDSISQHVAQVNDGVYSISLGELAAAIEARVSERCDNEASVLYKSVNQQEEFGVSRLIADRMNHLPHLLQSASLEKRGDCNYLVSAQVEDSGKNLIRLEHRYKATNEEEARKLYEKISTQMAGIHLKIWLACWKLANERKALRFECSLADIMRAIPSKRTGYISVGEKIEFFEYLRSIEQTKVIYSRCGVGKAKKPLSFEMRLLSINATSGVEDKYPKTLVLTIMDSAYLDEKIANVGVPFKNRTLELRPDDTQLAAWIQTRKAQIPDKKSIEVDLTWLFKLAGLEKTKASNQTQAKKLLMEKLKRLFEKGILLQAPKELKRKVCLKIR